ncbi:C-C motif chemokine 4-like [Conger conger]|uniref:C-C motif chemokine 4-like n=1 Tax=Conger conger TaxID=82655 RepID=UPI002A59872D|nr:C-C motif chemokine 4-like [Conger conger]
MKTLRNALLCLAVLQLCPSSSYSGPVASCCLRTSETIVPRKNIIDYDIQKKGICPVEAVIFITVKGKRFCLNPTNTWVNKTMDYLNGKKRGHLTTTISYTTSEA